MSLHYSMQYSPYHNIRHSYTLRHSLYYYMFSIPLFYHHINCNRLAILPTATVFCRIPRAERLYSTSSSGNTSLQSQHSISPLPSCLTHRFLLWHSTIFSWFRHVLWTRMKYHTENPTRQKERTITIIKDTLIVFLASLNCLSNSFSSDFIILQFWFGNTKVHLFHFIPNVFSIFFSTRLLSLRNLLSLSRFLCCSRVFHWFYRAYSYLYSAFSQVVMPLCRSVTPCGVLHTIYMSSISVSSSSYPIGSPLNRSATVFSHIPWA